MKNVICIIGVAGASLLVGCGQGPKEDAAAAEPSATSTEALDGVQGCIDEAKSCAVAARSVADGQACEQKLRACLAPLIADAGAVTLPPISIPDAGLPPVPDPNQVQAAVKACLATLATCLAGPTDPATCADQARTCLRHVL
jgi:hypothetical protein